MNKLKDLIEDSRTNHYKLLTLIGDSQVKKDEIISHLKNNGWEVCDVEKIVLNLMGNIPKEKAGTRLGKRLKKELKKFGEKIILDNVDILFSPEVGRLDPIEFFKYSMRSNKEGILFLNARIRREKAIYATPDRDEYKEMSLSEITYEKIDDVIVGGDN